MSAGREGEGASAFWHEEGLLARAAVEMRRCARRGMRSDTGVAYLQGSGRSARLNLQETTHPGGDGPCHLFARSASACVDLVAIRANRPIANALRLAGIGAQNHVRLDACDRKDDQSVVAAQLECRATGSACSVLRMHQGAQGRRRQAPGGRGLSRRQ